jgi:hypothetical protein
MIIASESRGSESDVIDQVTRVVYSGDAGRHDVTTPNGTWDFVFRLRAGEVQVLQTGQIDRPITLDYEPGDSYLNIAFRPQVFMPRAPGSIMSNRGVFHPLSGRRKFSLDGDRFEIPTFENAEGFAAALVARGLLVRDSLVRDAVESDFDRIDNRQSQRRFLKVTGLRAKTMQQIFRANRAVALLEAGRPIADVVALLGYTDQSHLTNSLRRIIGRTPGLVRGRAP